MPHAERSAVIAKPVADVFAFFTDPARETSWRAGVKEFTPQGPVAVGTVITQQVAGPMGRGIPADIEINALEPDRRYAFKGIAGPVRPVGEYIFEPIEGGTRVTFRLSAEIGGLKKAFMNGPVQKSMDAEVAALDTAKGLIEG